MIWNPIDYQNITKIRIDSSKLWIPDILVYNSAAKSFDPKTMVKTIINYEGIVNYRPFCVFKATCSINMRVKFSIFNTDY